MLVTLEAASSVAHAKRRRWFQVHYRMVHAGHAPASLGLPAHGHASPVHLSPHRLDCKFVFVPNCFADGMERALPNIQPRRGLLVKIALAEIAGDLLAPVEFRVLGEKDNLGI